ncbi:hypothetical protein NMY22_g5857 [Coprinellus aureogranulatus]|nr:hypothetical protein NMY22_g5857 [Coprinellus aureogranulatus]
MPRAQYGLGANAIVPRGNTDYDWSNIAWSIYFLRPVMSVETIVERRHPRVALIRPTTSLPPSRNALCAKEPNRIMAHIVELPLDLVLGIANLLGPQSILRLQSSCRTLRARLTIKAIWIQALRTVCRAHSVFYASYPVAEMSVMRLQRAAMSPARFTRLLDAHASFEYPACTVQPTGVTDIDIGEAVVSERHFLVPGGRFLAISNPRSLRLFDLGSPDCKALASPILLLSEDIGQHIKADNERTEMTVRMFDESTLRVVVLLRLQNTMALAYDIAFESGKASVRHIGTLRIDTPSPELEEPHLTLSSSHKTSVIQLGAMGNDHEVTVIWNISCRWYAFGLRTGMFAKQHVIINGTTVIQQDGTSQMAIWSCAEQHLLTYPVDPATQIKLPTPYEEYHSADAIPSFDLPFRQPNTPDDIRTCTFFGGAWADTGDKHSAWFDIMVEGSPYPLTLIGTEELLPPVLAYRGRILPSLDAAPYHTDPPVFETKACFRFPSTLSGRWSGDLEPQLPFNTGTNGGSHWLTGSALMVLDGEAPRHQCGMVLYSVPAQSQSTDTSDETACSVRGLSSPPHVPRGIRSDCRILRGFQWRFRSESMLEPGSLQKPQPTAYVSERTLLEYRLDSRSEAPRGFHLGEGLLVTSESLSPSTRQRTDIASQRRRLPHECFSRRIARDQKASRRPKGTRSADHPTRSTPDPRLPASILCADRLRIPTRQPPQNHRDLHPAPTSTPLTVPSHDADHIFAGSYSNWTNTAAYPSLR